MPAPNSERTAETRNRILAAARSSFLSAGFAGSRIADIARAAGVGKGTVYEHWRTKEELLLEACLDACHRAEDAMAGLMGSDPEAAGAWATAHGFWQTYAGRAAQSGFRDRAAHVKELSARAAEMAKKK